MPLVGMYPTLLVGGGVVWYWTQNAEHDIEIRLLCIRPFDGGQEIPDRTTHHVFCAHVLNEFCFIWLRCRCEME